MNSVTLNLGLLLNLRNVTVTLSQNVLIFVSNTSQLIRLVHYIINDRNYLVFWKEIGIKPRVAFLKCFSKFIETTEFTDSQSENHFGVSSNFMYGQK